jgi:hypothetical protein
MNEIIDDLKNQALEWAMETLDPKQVNEYEWAVAIDKKFAELIVRECAYTIRMTEFGDNMTQEQIARHIENYFQS